MKSRIIILVSIILIGLTIWKLSANKEKMNEKLEQSMTVNTIIPVIIEKPELTRFENRISLYGVIVPENDVLIVSQTQGMIIRKYKKMGDKVHKGEVIVEIENEVLKKSLSVAQADYEQRYKDLQRYQSLQKQGAVAQQEVENSQMSLREVEERISNLRHQIASTTIKSPSSGIISKDFVDDGEWVTTGSEVAHIISGNELKLRAEATEADMLEISKGQQAQIHISSLKNSHISGVVDRIAPNANELHFYSIEILLKDADGRLKPGMYAVANIESSEAEVPQLTLSRKSIIGGMKNPSVFIVKDGKAYKKRVQTGYYDDKRIEIKSGVSVHDTVINSGHINLSDETPVYILNRY